MNEWERRCYWTIARGMARNGPSLKPLNYDEWFMWLSFESLYQKKMEEEGKNLLNNYEKRKKRFIHILELFQKVERQEASEDECFELICFLEGPGKKSSNLNILINSKFSPEELEKLKKKVNFFKKLSQEQIDELLDLAEDSEIREEFSMEDEYILYKLSKYEGKYKNKIYEKERNERYKRRLPKLGVLPHNQF